MWNPRRLQPARLGAFVLIGALGLGLSPSAAARPHPRRRARPGREHGADRDLQHGRDVVHPAGVQRRQERCSPPARTSSRSRRCRAGQRRERVRKRLLDCATCTWDGWIPVPAVQGGQPILWRSDKFTFLGRDWIEVAPETFVGEPRRGPGDDAREVRRPVRLLDKRHRPHDLDPQQPLRADRPGLRRRSQRQRAADPALRAAHGGSPGRDRPDPARRRAAAWCS